MTEKHFELISMPASREPVSLLAVDRAVSEVRRGRPIAVRGAGGVAVLVQAAEAVTPEALQDIGTISHSPPVLAITARRASVLGLAESLGTVVTLAPTQAPNRTMGEDLTADLIRDLADPLSDRPLSDAVKASLSVTIKETPTYDCESAAVALK